MDYTTHVSWPTKRPDFWKTWGLLACLIFTIVGPLCYAAEITKSVAKNGLREAKFPEFSLQTCCSNNILLWLCYMGMGVPLVFISVILLLLNCQFLVRVFSSLVTLIYFVYFPAFLICGASDNNHSSVYRSFFKLPFSGLEGYYKLVVVYLLWQGVAGAIAFIPAFFVGVGIGALALKAIWLGAILLGVFVLLLLFIVFTAQPYIFMAMASLVGDYMRVRKEELIEKDILDEKTFLMSNSLEE